MKRKFTLIYNNRKTENLFEFSGVTLEDTIPFLIELIESEIDNNGHSVLSIQEVFETYIIDKISNIKNVTDISEDSTFIIKIDAQKSNLTLYRNTIDNISINKLGACKVILNHSFNK